VRASVDLHVDMTAHFSGQPARVSAATLRLTKLLDDLDFNQ